MSDRSQQRSDSDRPRFDVPIADIGPWTHDDDLLLLIVPGYPPPPDSWPIVFGEWHTTTIIPPDDCSE